MDENETYFSLHIETPEEHSEREQISLHRMNAYLDSITDETLIVFDGINDCFDNAAQENMIRDIAAARENASNNAEHIIRDDYRRRYGETDWNESASIATFLELSKSLL